MFKLPTREECQSIVKNTEAFYCTETIIDGCKVEMYNYRLAGYNDFKDNNAFELRGLTFIETNGVWERYIALNKFFNINQTPDWLESDVKDKKIVSVQDKADGSLITFVMINDEVTPKTKMSFDNEQTAIVKTILAGDDELYTFIDMLLFEGFTPIFELVSPHNQIVLEYNKTKLLLLQVRKPDGSYFTIEQLQCVIKPYSTVELVDSFIGDFTLEQLLKMKETAEGVEGWVITFEDGQMAKVKTDWYMRLHGTLTSLREDNVIELTLNEEIDDILSMAQGERKDFIEKVMELTMHKFNHLVIEYKELRRKYFQDFEEDRKKFAMTHFKDRLFPYVTKDLNVSFKEIEVTAEKRVKEYILKETNAFEKAKEWLYEKTN